jgi:hypothetical protein
MASLKNIVTDMADYVRNSGFTVTASMGEETVEIVDTNDNTTAFFLEYDAAVEFIENAEKLATDSGLDLDTAMYCEAKSYVDCI